MYRLWVEDKSLGLLTNITIFKDNDKECYQEFKKYYSDKYIPKKAVKYKQREVQI